MKKLIKIFAIVLCLAIGMAVFTACGKDSAELDILVLSREASSGTRDGFDGWVKKGDKTLKTVGDANWVDGYLTVTSTGAMITKVQNAENAIGYASYPNAKANSAVKSLKVAGISPEESSYAMRRPFVAMVADPSGLNTLTADFYAYLKSPAAKAIVTANGYFEAADTLGTAYTCSLTATVAATEKISIRGSTSAESVFKKIIAAYITATGNKVADVNFDLNLQGSAYGRDHVNKNLAANASADLSNRIGLSSSNETSNAQDGRYIKWDFAIDVVAVIVNANNSLENITLAQLYDIYTGEITKFSQVTAA